MVEIFWGEKKYLKIDSNYYYKIIEESLQLLHIDIMRMY